MSDENDNIDSTADATAPNSDILKQRFGDCDTKWDETKVLLLNLKIFTAFYIYLTNMLLTLMPFFSF